MHCWFNIGEKKDVFHCVNKQKKNHLNIRDEWFDIDKPISMAEKNWAI